jgi:hypothetical protein
MRSILHVPLSMWLLRAGLLLVWLWSGSARPHSWLAITPLVLIEASVVAEVLQRRRQRRTSIRLPVAR